MTTELFHVNLQSNLSPDPRESLSSEMITRLLSLANSLADLARQTVLEMKRQGFKVDWKPDGSPVSNVDKAVELSLRERIREYDAAHGILGEEFEHLNLESDFIWALDPIDGTEEFIHQIPLYGCMICLLYKHTPLLAVLEHPELNYRVSAAFRQGAFLNGQQLILSPDSHFQEGEERIFCAAKKQFLRDEFGAKIYQTLNSLYSNTRIYYTCFGHAAVAAGAFDAGIEYGLNIWDSIPALLICSEAGGKYRIIQQAVQPDGRTLYGFIFGKLNVVDGLSANLGLS